MGVQEAARGEGREGEGETEGKMDLLRCLPIQINSPNLGKVNILVSNRDGH